MAPNGDTGPTFRVCGGPAAMELRTATQEVGVRVTR